MDHVYVIERINHLREGDDWPDIYAGIDEVGVGSIAGPMVAAVVVLPPSHGIPRLPIDSKKLRPDAIQSLAGLIEAALTFAWIGGIDAHGVDALGTAEARLTLWRGAAAAVREALPTVPIVIDGEVPIPDVGGQRAIAKADDTYDAVSAAAILAKSRCDRIMAELDALYPGYGLAKHKGYGTKEHYLALERLGPSAVHRSNAARNRREGIVANEERDLPLDELQRMLRELAPVLKAHPELADEWSLQFLRDQWRKVIQHGALPSARAQYFIATRHRRIMKLARGRGLVAPDDGEPP